MGVKGLSKLIAPCGKLVSYGEYAGQYIAVDAFHRIYKCCVMKNMNDPYYKYAYIRSILSCITHLTQFGIAPVFVFDGMSLYFKTKYKALENKKKQDDLTIKSENIPFKIQPQQIKECEDLIGMLGLPCIRAPHEADSQCAAMTLLKCKNPVSIVLTDDTDALVFGAKAILKMLPMKMVNLLRDVFNEFVNTVNISQTNKYSISDILQHLNKMYLIDKISRDIDVLDKYDARTIYDFCDRNIVRFAVKITLNDVLNFLDTKARQIKVSETHESPSQIKHINHDDFVNLCLLLGTDYSRRTRNMPVEKIFELFVNNNYDISNILEPKNINIVRDYYEHASVIDPNKIDMTIYKPDYEIVYKFLKCFDFDPIFVTSIIRKYDRNILRMTR